MFKLKVLFPFLICFFFLQPLFACELSVRILHDPTLKTQNNKDNWQGSDIDYIKALLDKANCTFKLVTSPFARGLKLLKSGDIDMIINVSKNPTRESYLHFIGPQLIEKVRLVSRKGSIPLVHNWQQMSTLKATLVRQRGAYFGEKIERIFDTNKQLIQYTILLSDSNIRINMVNKNHIDGFFIESSHLSYQFKINPTYKILEVHPLVINSEPVYYAFSKKSVSEAQIKILSKAYQELIKTDILQKISEKYDSFD